MDELIYIALLVAWVAYSIYNAKQKKKQKELKPAPDTDSQPQYEPEQAEKPQRSILEELFGEGQFDNPQETYEEERTQMEEIPERPLAHAYNEPVTVKTVEDTPVTASGIAAEQKTISDEPSPYDTVITHRSDFDLRRAVIYSIILERRYQ